MHIRVQCRVSLANHPVYQSVSAIIRNTLSLVPLTTPIETIVSELFALKTQVDRLATAEDRLQKYVALRKHSYQRKHTSLSIAQACPEAVSPSYGFYECLMAEWNKWKQFESIEKTDYFWRCEPSTGALVCCLFAGWIRDTNDKPHRTTSAIMGVTSRLAGLILSGIANSS